MAQSLATQHGGESNPLDTTGLCLLSLDGGGVRGLSTLYILKGLMTRLNNERDKAGLPRVKPCEVFDLIGGTSTGGLIAIMLGRLEMDVDECITSYSELMKAVFEKKSSWLRISRHGKVKAQFDSAKLKSAVDEAISKTPASSADAFNDGKARGCRTFVCATAKETAGITRLRSYALPDEGEIPATIGEAALATSAATGFFDPVSIGARQFVDGALGANNPVDEVEGEAANIWTPDTGDLKPLVKCFVSIGTGHPGKRALEDNIVKFLSKSLVGIATETEETERKFIARWAKHYDEKRFFRFNVDQGLQDVGLAEYKEQGKIEAVTDEYLRHQAQKFRVRDCVENLQQKQSVYLEETTLAETHPDRLASQHALAKDNDGKMPLQWSVSSWRPNKAVLRSLTDSDTGANAESSDNTPEALAQALAHRDSSAVRQLLEHEFDNVARDKYEWLHELFDMGHSWYEIAGLLLEEANDAPWIYFGPEDQPVHGLNSQSPSMTAQDSLETTSLSSPWMSKRHDIRTLIQRLCGLGGIAPTSRSLHDWNGEVIFEENFSTSYISYASSSQNVGVTHQSTVVSRLRRVLKDLCKAVAALQSANMCREDYTIARISVSPTVPRSSNVELKKVDIALVIALRTEIDGVPSGVSSGMLDLTKPLDIALEILRPLLPHDTAFSTKLHTTEESLHVCCLAAQFLCVGLVSFCQGHVGPIESVFTNHSQERSVLLGNRTLGENPGHLRPYIAVRLSKLTCLGQMVEGPLITFTMLNEWPGGNIKTHDVVREAPLDRLSTKLSQLGLDEFFADQSEHHVEATPHDILYTWGPGRLILSGQDESLLRAIRVGGGIIYKDEGGSEFHWEAGSGPSELPNVYFHCQSKITVGASVTENTTQCSFPWQTWRASCTLVYLAVEPERWDPNQRQLGLQAGPDHVALQAMQVWTKVPAKLLKQYQLRHDDFDTVEFLGCYVGVQVSCCTGIARRISLRELLSDLMPKYCVTYMGEAGWNDWNTKYNILTGLRSSDVREWLFKLRRHLVKVCDDLFGIVHRILKVLEPTGLNRARTHIQIAWPKEGDFLRGIKVSCKDKHLWAQVLADSEEGTTFAYMTTTCLLCVGSSCQQSEQGWKMRPKCLGTAVTRYQNELEQESQSDPWALQDGRLYHMWNEKRYIRMKADVVGSPYRLIASESAIPSYMALRHFRGRRYKAKNLIRERHHPDDAAVDVLLLDKD